MSDALNPADIARIFDLQDRHRHAVRATSAAQRAARLTALRAAIVAHLPAAVAAMAEDFRKPAFEAAMEVTALFGEIDTAVANLEQWMRPVEVTPSAHAAPGARARILREPKGRVLIFGPWNFPFALLLQPLVGAIAAGNVCVLKPSELTPATSAVCVRLVRAVFDEAEVAILEGGPELAAALLDHPFDHIFFTGSTKVGKLVMAAAARHLSSVTLELGGKSPVIIDEDADLAQAASRISWGKYMNAGQICLSPDYVLVKPAQRDAFVDQVARAIRASFYEDDALNEADVARIVDDRNLQRLNRLIDDAVSRGARVAVGGKVRAGRRIEPTVLVDVPRDAAIMREEIFGPVMPVLTYDDLDDALREINRRDKPLALYVFSRRPEFIEAVLARTSSGGATINDVIQHVAEPNLPFGGVGPSGHGAYHGMYSFLAFSHERSVYYQAAENPMEGFSRPPYAGKVEVLVNMMGM
ncbi:aldehyde dehydrogenase family protein [Pseudoduganella namucuonensis]|uniref:Aldehyde dehydrogenase n=1 Tax=Pseudoduganella namucuonensis TaxID=1035707 RepID=A0A1I7KRZ4_9BURK|nr:aldehyde dehydrogenase family protein [Pseudoduganella namucuonensis]SFV00211.1 aldehyde dehydrogenase (NAD+) [Pseudoduganella namucuonensis]